MPPDGGFFAFWGCYVSINGLTDRHAAYIALVLHLHFECRVLRFALGIACYAMRFAVIVDLHTPFARCRFFAVAISLPPL